MKKIFSFNRWRWAVPCLSLVCLLLPLPAAAGLKYFKDSYDLLQKKACTLAADGSLASFNSSDAVIKDMAFSKTNILDSFYGMARGYGHDDVPGAAMFLRNEVRLNWNIKQFKKSTALEALYCSEASIKFFLEKDKAVSDPKLPALLPGYEDSILQMVGQAESAFASGQYANMRKYFYHAIWIAYPVTSRALFSNP